MNKKSLKELSVLLQNKKTDLEKDILLFENNDNTQIKELYIKSKIELSLIENILEYTKNGIKSYLK